MIKNIEAAKQLVRKYNDIHFSENRELEDIDVNGGYYMNYGEYLQDMTKFNSWYCTLCIATRNSQGKTECKSCIWSLIKNGSKDFKRVRVESIAEDAPERYCINKNYDEVNDSIYLVQFKEALGKRIDKLEQLIKKAKQLNKEEENEE